MSKFVPKLARVLAALSVIVFLGGAEAFAGGSLQGLDAGESSSSAKVKYIIKEGDTLYDIAQKSGFNLDELMTANSLTGSLIRTGEIIVLPEKNDKEKSLSSRKLSREDLKLLAKLIHAEARGECFEGQVAVGAVILNRLESPHFPKTVKEVIYQKNNVVYQFSPVGDGSINLEPDERAIQAAAQAVSGEDPTGGALFFYNPEISRDRWIKTLPVVTKIGNHVFAKSI